MSRISFPFQQTSYFTLSEGKKQFAPIEAEEAVGQQEIYQALNYRSLLDFTRPLVLHFSNPLVQMPVWFGFSFDVEVLVIGLDGTVQKAYTVPKHQPGSALFVQFFCDYDSAILVPKGFIKKWGIKEQETRVRRIRMTAMLEKTA